MPAGWPGGGCTGFASPRYWGFVYAMRNVWLLCIAQALSGCGTIMLVAFGGIIGTELAPSMSLATLPLSLSIVGLATASLPAALLMQRIGRRAAFVGSALVALVAALFCAASIANASFVGLCIAGFLLGSNMAFVQQYRFAATEYVAPSEAARAIGAVMIGTLGAAFIGPLLGELTRDAIAGPRYTGSFVALAALCALAAIILTRLPRAPIEQPASASPPLPRAAASVAASAVAATADAATPAAPLRVEPARSLSQIVAQPAYRFAVLAALVAYAVMSFIMTATPISMHVHDGFSGSQTSTVISAHLLGMYLPSLATPWLIRRLGTRGLLVGGTAAMVACIAIGALMGHRFTHYFGALVLLGVGWNFMFVAATAMLTRTYAPAERFRAQGLNDMMVFGAQALASLLAGTAVATFGWSAVNWVALPPLILLMIAARRLQSRVPGVLA
jgi:MFS family permease